MALPEACEYFCQPNRKLGDWDTLYVDLRLPENFPADALIYLWVKDWDSQWYQALASRTSGQTGDYFPLIFYISVFGDVLDLSRAYPSSIFMPNDILLFIPIGCLPVRATF